jgi:predicted TPR repeat methyltransferase
MMTPLSSLFLSSGDPTLDRRHEWARGLIERGETVAAAELLEETLMKAPGFIAGWFLLGEAREMEGDLKAASNAFRRVIVLDPEDRLGAGLHLAKLGGRKSAYAMSRAYVRTLFDQYAGRFDRELVEALGYNAPTLLRAAIDSKGERRFKRALDLGCGTGLMGEAIRDKVDELVGVDISGRMIEIATRKKIYDSLGVSDLVEFLENEKEAFDLILAADVFVYCSDLKPIFTAASHKLSPLGLFAFTVETHEGKYVILRDTLRFAHAEKYLRDTSNAASLEISLLEKVSTRKEKNIPVEGLLAILRPLANSAEHEH